MYNKDMKRLPARDDGARRRWTSYWPIVTALVIASATLAGCVSASDVAATPKPGTYQVAATATGGRMAWARAHEHALNEARDYCEQRGMQVSVSSETVSGVQMLTQHDSSVNFECHPRF
jgi:UDP-N-acetylglucosamine enolpyruvyl transferase